MNEAHLWRLINAADTVLNDMHTVSHLPSKVSASFPVLPVGKLRLKEAKDAPGGRTRALASWAAT